MTFLLQLVAIAPGTPHGWRVERNLGELECADANEALRRLDEMEEKLKSESEQ